jgi:hypothetical protein
MTVYPLSSSSQDFASDSKADLAVSAPGGVGRIYLFYGRNSQFTTDAMTFAPGATKGFTCTGTQNTENLGFLLASAGDVNGDGKTDLMVANKFQKVFVIFGGSGSPVTAVSTSTTGIFYTITTSQSADTTWPTAITAGDFNLDTYTDIIISWHSYSSTHQMEGCVWKVMGSASLAVNTAITLPAQATLSYHGGAANMTIGTSLANAGDVNGDGVTDLLVGAPLADINGSTDSGAVYLVYGARDPYPTSQPSSQPSAQPSLGLDFSIASTNSATRFMLKGDVSGDWMGWSVANIGDYNGDRYNDLLACAPMANTMTRLRNGMCAVVFGQPGTRTEPMKLSELTGTRTTGFLIHGSINNERFGFSATRAGTHFVTISSILSSGYFI